MTLKQKKTKTEQLVAWLDERPALSIKKLEEEAAIPFTTISQAIRGREIPEKHWPAIVNVLIKYGLNPKLIKVK